MAIARPVSRLLRSVFPGATMFGLVSLRERLNKGIRLKGHLLDIVPCRSAQGFLSAECLQIRKSHGDFRLFVRSQRDHGRPSQGEWPRFAIRLVQTALQHQHLAASRFQQSTSHSA